MCFSSDPFIHHQTQFKDSSKFTNSPGLISQVVHPSTKNTSHFLLYIFAGCAPPLWPSSESLEFTSFISVFPTTGPVSGLYGRQSKYAEMNEFSLDHEEEACYWKHEGGQVVLRSHQDFKGQGLNSKTCLQTGKIMAYTYQTFSGKLLLGSKNTQI